jgi:hypothetical protein
MALFQICNCEAEKNYKNSYSQVSQTPGQESNSGPLEQVTAFSLSFSRLAGYCLLKDRNVCVTVLMRDENIPRIYSRDFRGTIVHISFHIRTDNPSP